MLEDVLENTRPEDDLPPADEFFTCICNSSVRPPPNGVQSDAVQCDHCFARFHGECAKNEVVRAHSATTTIGMARSTKKGASTSVSCLPFSPAHLKSPRTIRSTTSNWKSSCIESIASQPSSGQFLAYTSTVENQRPEYLAQVRHYMCKLYKIQFTVSPNPDISFGLDLAGLHRILAGRPLTSKSKKRRRPRFAFGQDIDQDASDGLAVSAAEGQAIF